MSDFIVDDSVIVKKVGNTLFKQRDNIFELISENIMVVTAVGPQTEEMASAILSFYSDLFKDKTEKISYLIDLNKAGKSSTEARKIWKTISEMETTHRVALVGIHPVARVLAAFVMSVTLESRIQFFSTAEKGLKWIRE